MEHENRVAIVTGAARGIGRATAEVLHDAGAFVAIADVDETRAIETANSLGERALPFLFDASQVDSIAPMVEKVRRAFGRVDILVNNAGICARTRALDITEEEWDRLIGINLKGAFFCCQAVMPLMISQGWGRIINLASISGKIGGLMVGVHYAVSKGGILAMTKGLARELAPHGITVNAVCPALVDTDISALFSDEELSRYLSSVPLARLATVYDVAHAIAYLCSEKAGYITGEVLDVNGGLLMD